MLLALIIITKNNNISSDHNLKICFWQNVANKSSIFIEFNYQYLVYNLLNLMQNKIYCFQHWSCQPKTLKIYIFKLLNLPCNYREIYNLIGNYLHLSYIYILRFDSHCLSVVSYLLHFIGLFSIQIFIINDMSYFSYHISLLFMFSFINWGVP